MRILGQRPRRVSTALLALALAACVCPLRVAGASPLQWEGTLSIEVLGLESLHVRGGGVSSVDGPGGGAFLRTLRLAASRGGVAGTAMVPISDPNVQAMGIHSVRATASLGSGSFAPISGGTGAEPLSKRVLPLRGIAKLCQLSTSCNVFLPIPLTQPTAPGPGAGSKGVGIGGLVTAGGVGPFQISVEGAPWTLYTATVGVASGGGGSVPVFASGFVHGAGSLTGSTGLPGGSLQLVTPIRVRSNQGHDVAAFGHLHVRFLPEPGWLVLLGAGLAGLGCIEFVRSRT